MTEHAMRSITRVGVRNFRSLREVNVDLRPLNVIVGPNAGGKSNFRDVFEFLGDAVREDLRPALNKRGGIDRVRFRQETRGVIMLEIDALTSAPGSEPTVQSYTLKFAGRRPSTPSESREQVVLGTRMLVREEELRFNTTPNGQGHRITVNGSRVALFEQSRRATKSGEIVAADSLGLSILPRLPPGHWSGAMRPMSDLFRTFRVFDVDVALARQPAPISEGRRILPDGSNLSSAIFWLSQDAALFAEFLDDARAMVPGLRQIHFRTAGPAAETVSVELSEYALRSRTTLVEASHGAVRALALLALLHDPAPPPLTCIEEIATGLHPQVFERLLYRLRAASNRTQLLLVTHSPTLVSYLGPNELIVCERDAKTGETRMGRATSEDAARSPGERATSPDGPLREEADEIDAIEEVDSVDLMPVTERAFPKK